MQNVKTEEEKCNDIQRTKLFALRTSSVIRVVQLRDNVLAILSYYKLICKNIMS